MHASLLRLALPLCAMAAMACVAQPMADGSVVPPPSPTPPPNARGPYLVTDIVDGDTFRLDITGKPETVRLLGIDTPETVHPNKPVQCYGPEAAYWLTTATPIGSKVWIFNDPSQDERDKYGRLLVFAWVDGGALINQVAVAKGYAREYTYKTAHQFQAQFRADQAMAKANRYGIWGVCPDAEAWAASDADTPIATATTSAMATPGSLNNVAAVQPSPGATPTAEASTPPPSSAPTPAPTAVAAEPVTGDCGPDQVYVKGYTRKDGTYVHAYCRKKPS